MPALPPPDAVDILAEFLDQTLSMGQLGDIPDKIFANTISPPLGTRPAYPGKRSLYNSMFSCYKNPLPNFNGAPTGPLDGGGATMCAGRVR